MHHTQLKDAEMKPFLSERDFKNAQENIKETIADLEEEVETQKFELIMMTGIIKYLEIRLKEANERLKDADD
jgi:predicted S18 family serine protease